MPFRPWIFNARRRTAYRPRPDDIVIPTYPKTVTTWMQQIVSSLRRSPLSEATSSKLHGSAVRPQSGEPLSAHRPGKAEAVFNSACGGGATPDAASVVAGASAAAPSTTISANIGNAATLSGTTSCPVRSFLRQS